MFVSVQSCPCFLECPSISYLFLLFVCLFLFLPLFPISSCIWLCFLPFIYHMKCCQQEGLKYFSYLKVTTEFFEKYKFDMLIWTILLVPSWALRSGSYFNGWILADAFHSGTVLTTFLITMAKRLTNHLREEKFSLVCDVKRNSLWQRHAVAGAYGGRDIQWQGHAMAQACSGRGMQC